MEQISVKLGDHDLYPIVVFVRLMEAIERFENILAANEQSADLNFIAWICRSINELRIWAEWCGRSAENATEFYEDAVRDVAHMNRSGDLDDATTNAINAAISTLTRADAPTKFKRVEDVAKNVGLEGLLNASVLNKYVHPTAMSIVAPFSDEFKSRIAVMLIEEARCTLDEALHSLESSELAKWYEQAINQPPQTGLDLFKPIMGYEIGTPNHQLPKSA